MKQSQIKEEEEEIGIAELCFLLLFFFAMAEASSITPGYDTSLLEFDAKRNKLIKREDRL